MRPLICAREGRLVRAASRVCAREDLRSWPIEVRSVEAIRQSRAELGLAIIARHRADDLARERVIVEDAIAAGEAAEMDRLADAEDPGGQCVLCEVP